MNIAAKADEFGKNTLPLITADQLAVDFAHITKAVEDLEEKSTTAPPVLEDDDDLELVTGLIGDFGKYAKRVDAIRDDNKRPHLEAGNTIHAFFKALEGRLLQTKKSLELRGTTYMNKKAEAERRVRLAEEQKAREAAAVKEKEAAAALAANKPDEAHAAQAAADNLSVRADNAADAAAARPADLARTTTDAGTATLSQVWEFEIQNIDTIDLEALRPFLPRAAIEQAMRGFVKSGRREIKGARIFSKNAGRFRT